MALLLRVYAWLVLALRRLPTPLRPYLPVAVILMAVLLGVSVALSVRDAALLGGGVLIGVVAASWPRLRQWLSVPNVSRELSEQARLEGLSTGSLKLGPGLIIVALTAVATALDTSTSRVLLALGAFAAVGAVAVVYTAWRLRVRPEERPTPRLVLWSFLLMGAGMAGVAAARNVWMLALALAVMGASAAVNTRYRYDALSRFPEAPGAFQTLSRRWSQAIAWLGLVVLGALAASPVGWEGAAAVTAAWFVVLGVLVYRARSRRANSYVPPAKEHPSLGRVLKLHSVRRFLLVVVLATAIGRASQSHLEPVLASDLGRSSSTWAAILIATAQLFTMGAIARINKRAERSPGQEARRSMLWMAAAALIATGAAASPWAWLTVTVSLAWLLFAEVASGGTSQTTRLGLQRSGQLASLLGAALGNLGLALGSMIAALPIMSHALGIGLVLLLGTVACASAASWRRERASRERATTVTSEVVIALRPDGERQIVVTVREPNAPEKKPLKLFDGDALGADTQFDARPNCERLPLLQIPMWRGPLWPPHAVLARLFAGRTLRDPWPRTMLPFASADLGGTVRWRGAGKLDCQLVQRADGIHLLLRLPDAERFPVTWFPLRRRDLSELPTEPVIRTPIPGT